MGEKGRSQLQRDMRDSIYATIAGAWAVGEGLPLLCSVATVDRAPGGIGHAVVGAVPAERAAAAAAARFVLLKLSAVRPPEPCSASPFDLPQLCLQFAIADTNKVRVTLPVCSANGAWPHLTLASLVSLPPCRHQQGSGDLPGGEPDCGGGEVLFLRLVMVCLVMLGVAGRVLPVAEENAAWAAWIPHCRWG